MRRDTDPCLCFRFALELGHLEIGGFNECTGVESETKITEHREGGRNFGPHKFPEVGQVSNVTLKRGLVTGPGADALFNWHQDVLSGRFDQAANPNRRPSDTAQDIDRRIAIVLQDEAGNEVRRWNLFRAFPVKWTGPELKAMDDEVAFETLELACEGIELG